MPKERRAYAQEEKEKGKGSEREEPQKKGESPTDGRPIRWAMLSGTRSGW